LEGGPRDSKTKVLHESALRIGTVKTFVLAADFLPPVFDSSLKREAERFIHGWRRMNTGFEKEGTKFFDR
jgi:hypothetical protein